MANRCSGQIYSEMKKSLEDELKGFEYELTDMQSYADSFEEETSVSNLASEQGMLKDGSFSGNHF